MSAGLATAPAAKPPASAVLARSLLRCAVDVFSQVPAPERGPALLALDQFLATPSPAVFLSTLRTLREVQQASALRQARMSRAEQDFVRGLELVRREISPEVAEVLAALPIFEEASPSPASASGQASSAPEALRRASGAGPRLRALALLAAAHQELADRVAGSAEKLRQHLARAKDAHAQQDKPAARRRSPAARPARQSTTTSTKK